MPIADPAEASIPDVKQQVVADGFSIVRAAFSRDQIDRAIAAIEAVEASSQVHRRSGSAYAIRNLLEQVPRLRELGHDSRLRNIVQRVLGGDPQITRAILFDKNPEANWGVPWHQDTTIAVQDRRDVGGFGPWSIKEGIHHVQPPAAILEGMLTARAHLDDCDANNGALLVLPGSHRDGILDAARIGQCKHSIAAEVCSAAAGDIVFMRPLILHSSASSTKPSHRRVVHLEFAAARLPEGLEWRLA